MAVRRGVSVAIDANRVSMRTQLVLAAGKSRGAAIKEPAASTCCPASLSLF